MAVRRSPPPPNKKGCPKGRPFLFDEGAGRTPRRGSTKNAWKAFLNML